MLYSLVSNNCQHFTDGLRRDITDTRFPFDDSLPPVEQFSRKFPAAKAVAKKASTLKHKVTTTVESLRGKIAPHELTTINSGREGRRYRYKYRE